MTNLDFIQLLFEIGADPNAQDHLGRTPLMYTIQFAPIGVAYHGREYHRSIRRVLLGQGS
jgi:hypothetical protein